jgi:hypothetical protein
VDSTKAHCIVGRACFPDVSEKRVSFSFCPVASGTYDIAVAAINGASTSGNQSPASPTTGTVNYTVDAVAFTPGSAGQADCSPPELQTSQTSGSAPLTVTPGASVTAATLTFTGCTLNVP